MKPNTPSGPERSLEEMAIEYCNEHHKGGSRTYLKCIESYKAGFYAASKGGSVDNWNRLLKYIDTMPFAGSEDHSHLVNVIQQEFMSMERKSGFLADSPKGKEDAEPLIAELIRLYNKHGEESTRLVLDNYKQSKEK